MATEKFAADGIQKNVHIVVKNTPFLLDVSLSGNKHKGKFVDFNQAVVEATLTYDCEDNKTVDFVRVKPLEYKSTVNDRADVTSIELKIKVLSSQLEDSLFRIRLALKDLQTKAEISGVIAYSQPIKVVSKPEQVRKRQQRALGKPIPKKRTFNDVIKESLQRIEQQQKMHQDILTSLVEVVNTDFSAASNKKQKAASTFEDSFRNLLCNYETLTTEERAERIRRIIRTSSVSEQEEMREMMDMFLAEGLHSSGRHVLTSSGAFPFDGTASAGLDPLVALDWMKSTPVFRTDSANVSLTNSGSFTLT